MNHKTIRNFLRKKWTFCHLSRVLLSFSALSLSLWSLNISKLKSLEWVIVIANANACHLISWFLLICFHRFSQFLNFLTHLQPFLTNLQPLLLLIYNQFHKFLQKRKFQLFTSYGYKRVIKKPSILALFLDQKTKNQQTKRKRTLFLRSSSRNRVVYYYNSCIVKGLKKTRQMCL